jgi:DNA-directed RNA polymerase subunit beta'
MHCIEGVTFKEEADEQTGFREKVIIESRDKSKNPMIQIMSASGESFKIL